MELFKSENSEMVYQHVIFWDIRHNIFRSNLLKYFVYQQCCKNPSSIVISLLYYCNSTYIGLPTTTTHKLQLSHNAAARIINKTRRHEHITPILQELHWLPITKRVQIKVLVYTFKAFHNEAPIYLCDLLLWYHPNRPLRSANKISRVPHRHKTVKLSRRLLDTAAATLWNDLPDNIRNCDNTWTFKKLLKTYLF